MIDVHESFGSERGETTTMLVNGERLRPDLSGGLFWPRQSVLFVADMHFEKASWYATRGQMLPPYDTAATLNKLAQAVERLAPRMVICLGDSFHDREARLRLDPGDAAAIRGLTRGRDWIWIAGNHDPAPPADLGGEAVETVDLGPLIARHEPLETGAPGEIAGHLHPKAAVRVRGRRLSRRCFVGDGLRAILPSFGAFTGGLDVTDPAYRPLFPEGFQAHLIGGRDIHIVSSRRLAGV